MAVYFFISIQIYKFFFSERYQNIYNIHLIIFIKMMKINLGCKRSIYVIKMSKSLHIKG